MTDDEALLHATVWLQEHVRTDEDVRTAVAAVMAGHSYVTLSELARHAPAVVFGLYEGLRTMVEEIPPEETV